MAVILLLKNAETPGAFLRHQVVGRAFEAAGWEVVSLDIVSKFEPNNPLRHLELGLHDISGALRHGLGQPRLHGIQPRADDAPRRLLEGDALVLSALEIIAHFDPLMWVIETGLLKTRPFAPPWVDVTYCKYGTPYRKQTRLYQHALEAEAEPVQARQPLRGVAGRRAAQRGPRLMEGQYERVSQSRELLYSVPAALCEEIARAATEK